MKTTKQIRTCLALCAATLATAIVIWAPGTARADDMKPMKGAEHLMMLNKPVTTVEDANALTNNENMAMVCTKCKTVWVTRVKQGTKGAQMLMENGQPKELIGTHTCAGCKSELTVTGVGKGAKTELKHSCKMCGDDSAFCCATSPNTKPTPGMEDKK